MSLQNKSIIITGASKGIGKALAISLAAHQVKLSLVARSTQELETVKAAVEQAGSECLVFAGNVADETFVTTIINTTTEAFGGVDFMINNAGFGIFKRATDISLQEWESTYDTNVKGTFLFSKAVLPAMKATQSGHIINVASDVAKRVFDGGSLYCSSKYAQDAFSMALRKEVREFGIKVSVIYSGLVDSMFHTDPQGADSHQDWLKVEDMASAIMYVMNQPRHVVIDELMIHPLSQEY